MCVEPVIHRNCLLIVCGVLSLLRNADILLTVPSFEDSYCVDSIYQFGPPCYLYLLLVLTFPFLANYELLCLF